MANSQADSTQFKRDLADPSAGLNSDLYRAIAPTISDASLVDLSKDEEAKINRLKEDVRKGLVGLEYMTGIKKNKGETFYDEHPVQALATDALSKAPLAGLGLAGGGMLLNSFRQKKNMDKVMPASMARSGNTPDKDLSNPRALLNPREGSVRGDIAKIYGNADSLERMQLIDRLSDVPHTAPESLSFNLAAVKQLEGKAQKKYLKTIGNLNNQLSRARDDKQANKITKQIAGEEKLHKERLQLIKEQKDKLLATAKSAKGHKYLEKHVNLHEALQRAKEKGGFTSPVGSGLKLPKSIAPDKNQALVDLVERLDLTKNHPGFDKELLLRSIEDYIDDPKEFKRFQERSLPKITSKQHQNSGIRRFLSRHKFPLAAGAATAVGGTGLYYLLKALQNQMYSKDKVNEWKKTLLKSRGDFDAANQIR
jgi:hypothetical protein